MTRSPWNHNMHYHHVVLEAVPADCRRALDAGCGEGALARLLAQRSREVVAIDIDPAAVARAASGPGTHVSFRQGDVLTLDLGDESFDFVAAVALLHHLPLKPALARFRSLLKPGGVLAIIGLYRLRSPTDYAVAAAALPASAWLRLQRRYVVDSAPLREPAQTLREVRTACDAMLPGARFRRHLLFRYSVVWRKP